MNKAESTKLRAVLPRHIFLSYSRVDQAIAERLRVALASNEFEVWIDYSDIQPGTANWERDIRRAIERSFAVIYVASPSSRDSDAVAGELFLAKSCGCQVYPALASGEWADSARIDLSSSQYVDFREDKFEDGLTLLISRLRDLITQCTPEMVLLFEREYWDLGCHWRKHDLFELPDGKYALVRYAWNKPLDTLLDDFYVQILSSYVKPFSYGRDWVLAVGYNGIDIVVEDWQWLVRQAGREGLTRGSREWQERVTIRDFSGPGESCNGRRLRVFTDLTKKTFIGLAFPSMNAEAFKFFQRKGEKLLWGLLAGTVGMRVDSKSIDLDRCPKRYLLFVDPHFKKFGEMPRDGVAFIADELERTRPK